MTRTRLRILRHFLSGRRNGTSVPEMAALFFGRARARKAASYIRGTREAGAYLSLDLNGLPWPLFWPKAFPLSALEEVLVEILDRRSWHHYFREGHGFAAGDLVIDAGASEGLFSLLAAARGARVFAVEPLPEFQRSMARTFAPIPTVTVLPFALSNAPGSGDLRPDGICSTLSPGAGGIPVRIETLDRLLVGRDRPVRFIKADLEGFDVEALEGAADILVRDGPRLSLAAYHDPGHARRMEAFLKRCRPGYRVRTRGIYEETGAPIMLYAWCE